MANPAGPSTAALDQMQYHRLCGEHSGECIGKSCFTAMQLWWWFFVVVVVVVSGEMFDSCSRPGRRSTFRKQFFVLTILCMCVCVSVCVRVIV